MNGRQILVLAMLAVFVAAEFCMATLLVRPLLPILGGSLVGRGPSLTPTVTRMATLTPTRTPIPTSTSTLIPSETRPPTATATRVVHDTATRAPIQVQADVVGAAASDDAPATATRTATRVVRNRAPAATPTPSYPFKVVASQVYTTSNHFFMMYAQIKVSGVLVAGYRIVGTHYPSGITFESPPSCDFLCKASGATISVTPCCNALCTPAAGSLPPDVQSGNVAFEAPIYETGTYSLRLIDPQGQQVSDVLQVPIDVNDRNWFYYVYSK
jgi:hypothetical protein